MSIDADNTQYVRHNEPPDISNDKPFKKRKKKKQKKNVYGSCLELIEF